MNHVDAFRRGFAAVLVVSMLALAVAPASAGQQQGSGKALVAPSAPVVDADGGVVLSQGGGSGKALVSPSEVVAARSEGSGQAPPALSEGVLFGQGAGTGQAPPALAPGGVLYGQEGGTGPAPPSVAVVGLDAVGGATPAVAPA